MAKPTAPLLSFGGSGTIAKTMVYSTWKGRPYVRRHVIPANPNSTEQQATRNPFGVANQIWKLAPSLLVAPWDRFAQGQVLTGRNAFIGAYVKTLRGLANMDDLPFSPGAKGGLPATTVALTPGANQITVDFTTPTAPTGWTLQSAIAAAIVNGDPATTTLYETTADEDDVTQAQVVLAGLTTAVEYTVGGWLRWLKPDGTIAYGTSKNDQATPT